MGLGAFLKAKAPKMKGRPMPKRIAPLTVTRVRTIKPGKKPQKLFDGGGLFLLVTSSGGKLWNFKYRFEGKEKKLSCGEQSHADHGGESGR